MRKMVEKIIGTYGAPTLLLRQDGQAFALKAFLHPRKSLSQRNALKRISPLGEILGDTYLFICSVDCGAQVGDTVKQTGDIYYELRQVETVLYKNEPVYLWGLCVQKGGADTWDC
ncbi:MAG: hypothetical protein IJZ15_03485 [Oscillospiraceae bacterium]|nr:hypothetical protein [Oscillospiraceae bacterium]